MDSHIEFHRIHEKRTGELTQIREGINGVDRLCIYKISSDGWLVAFDITSSEDDRHEPGEKIEFGEELKPYIGTLFKGESVEAVESNGIRGWVMSAYYPIIDNSGICTGYATAEVSLKYVSDYMWDFMLRVLFIMLSFYILISACGLWVSGTGMVYPINSIERSVEAFINAGDNQRELDEAVRNMRAIDIQTGERA